MNTGKHAAAETLKAPRNPTEIFDCVPLQRQAGRAASRVTNAVTEYIRTRLDWGEEIFGGRLDKRELAYLGKDGAVDYGTE